MDGIPISFGLSVAPKLIQSSSYFAPFVPGAKNVLDFHVTSFLLAFFPFLTASDDLRAIFVRIAVD